MTVETMRLPDLTSSPIACVEFDCTEHSGAVRRARFSAMIVPLLLS